MHSFLLAVNFAFALALQARADDAALIQSADAVKAYAARQSAIEQKLTNDATLLGKMMTKTDAVLIESGIFTLERRPLADMFKASMVQYLRDDNIIREQSRLPLQEGLQLVRDLADWNDENLLPAFERAKKGELVNTESWEKSLQNFESRFHKLDQSIGATLKKQTELYERVRRVEDQAFALAYTTSFDTKIVCQVECALGIRFRGKAFPDLIAERILDRVTGTSWNEVAPKLEENCRNAFAAREKGDFFKGLNLSAGEAAAEKILFYRVESPDAEPATPAKTATLLNSCKPARP